MNGVRGIIGGIFIGMIAMGYASAEQRKPPAKPPAKTQANNLGGVDENNLIKQISNTIVDSEVAVACQIRTPDWRRTVLRGWIASLGMLYGGIEDEDEQDRQIAKVLKAAKVDAALATKFDSPTIEQCDELEATRMKDLDASASIGLLSGAVSDQ
jgi:hypothetical protein